MCAHTHGICIHCITYVSTGAFSFPVAASLSMCLTLSIFSKSQVQWCVSSLCYSVKSHSACDPDRAIGTVNQSNGKGRKWYMRTKGKETCLKAMSSVEVGGFGLLSRYSPILFPQPPKLFIRKTFWPSGRGPCTPSFSERQCSMDFGVRPVQVLIPDPLALWTWARCF